MTMSMAVAVTVAVAATMAVTVAPAVTLAVTVAMAVGTIGRAHSSLGGRSLVQLQQQIQAAADQAAAQALTRQHQQLQQTAAVVQDAGVGDVATLAAELDRVRRRKRYWRVQARCLQEQLQVRTGRGGALLCYLG